jgi:acetyltransferase-like isoleucine patch superfamily enzyme
MFGGGRSFTSRSFEIMTLTWTSSNGVEHRIRLALNSYWRLLFKLKCRMYGIECGSDLQVFGNVQIQGMRGCIKLGHRIILVSSSWRCSAAALNHPVRLRTHGEMARIILEDRVGLNGTSITSRSKTIRVGANTIIAPNCIIVDSDYHAPWPPETRWENSAFERDQDVIIGRNVWIGMNSLVLKGVRIGDNSVLAAGSVVVGDIPSNALAAGCPARVVKSYKPANEFSSLEPQRNERN